MAGKRVYEAMGSTNDDAEGPSRKRHHIAPSSSSAQNAASSRDDWEEEITGETDDDTLTQYGTMSSKVVGCQYYRGHATIGEFAIVRREPSNPYDSNAIQILNVLGAQIGHLGRGVASKLAPFMDDRSVFLEAKVTGHKGYDLPIDLRLFGTSDPQEQPILKQRMVDARLAVDTLQQEERERKKRQKEQQKAQAKRRQQELKEAAAQARGARTSGKNRQTGQQQGSSQWANPGGANDLEGLPSTSTGPDMNQIMEASVQFDPRALGQMADKYGADEEALSQLPLAEQPVGTTRLLPYQLQGLAWMIDRENPRLPASGSTDSCQLWRANAKNSTYTNIATSFTTTEPALASAGILADDMGLGKTLQILALILSDYRKKQPTLIVAPLSVMSNWVQQAALHVDMSKALKVLTYHGATKQQQLPADLEAYDIVVTTYQTLASEYMPSGTKSKPKPVPRQSGLFFLDWRRVVLDEGHHIRNPKTKASQACCNLQARSRWVLTGTPIVSNLFDLQSYLKFMRLSGGLEQREIFSSTLVRPLNQGRPEGAMLLKALMNTLCLRRMKDMKFIDLKLPELSSHRYAVAFHPEERKKYDAFAQEAKGLLLQIQKGKNIKTSHLLEVLLRMRQTCNHWKLCGDRVTNLLDLLEQNKKVDLTPQNLGALRDLLQLNIDSQETCPICFDSLPLHDPVITPCSHVFGRFCITKVLTTNPPRCPMCRGDLKPDGSELVAPLEAETAPDLDIQETSSKIEALINILKASRKKNPDTKTVVFSQFTSFLDVIQRQLSKHGFTLCRLDGKMNAAKRDEAMDSLATDPSCTVMLASLGVCSVGLNLVAANQVVLADSWWAPAIEDQAVDRVYRLGQTRPTTVFRLVMEDSIEGRVLDIQGEKRRLMATAFGEKQVRRGEKSARLADVEKLLGG